MVSFYKSQLRIFAVLILLILSSSLQASDGDKKVSWNFGFVANKGQIIDQNNLPNKSVLFLYSSSGFKVQLKQNSFSYEVYKSERLPCTCDEERMKFPNTPDYADYKFSIHRVDISFEGANPNPRIREYLPLENYVNYYTTTTPESGILNVLSYKKVVYENIYPNIDIEFLISDTEAGKFKYNFIVRPGGNINDIKLKFDGANKTTLTESGAIQIETSLGNIEENIPYSYQLNETQKEQRVNVNFKKISNNVYGLISEKYNLTKSLVIDPIPWATYFGGTLAETGYGINRDAAGNVYITGSTLSTNNMATSGAFQVTLAGGTDAYITKFNPNGSLLWSTFLGGTAADLGYVVVFDSIGNVLVGGAASSTTGIASVGAFQATLGGLQDCFLVKFTTAGARIWGTYYGGASANEIIYGLVADSGSIYAAGYTNVTTGTTMATAGSYQPAYGTGAYDAFIVRFTAAGNRVWGTYYGGTGDDRATSISRAANGDLLVAGQTTSTGSMASAGAFQTTFAGSICGYVARFTSAGNRVWSTYYGGTQNTVCVLVLPDIGGGVVTAGYTGSTSGIASTGAFQNTLGGGPAASPYDGFVARFTGAGTRLWATYYGGNDYDVGGFGLATDQYGNILMSGYSASLTGIASPNGMRTTNAGGTAGTAYDPFIVKFDSMGTRKWATYYGGPATDYGRAIVTDPFGYTYMIGYGASLTGISTPGAFQPANAGGDDTYILVLNDEGNMRPKAFNDAGVLSIDSPTSFCAGVQNIKVTIKNFGLNSINPVTVKWSLNGVLQTPIVYTSTLDTVGKVNNTAQITLGSYNFPSATLIKAWTSNPNNVTDTVAVNDTAMATKASSLSGSYTIDPSGSGSTNFVSFSAAASALNLAGVCGPVVITVAPGTYNEKVTLTNIAGTSAVNTITFDGVDSTNRKITFNETAVPLNLGVVNLQGTSYVTFINLGITALGTSTSVGVNLQNNSNYNKFTNCNIRVSSTSTSTSCYGIGICGTTVTTVGLGNNNSITSCNITGGYVGIALYGPSSTSFSVGNKITGCTISEVYYAGIHTYYQSYDTIADNKLAVRVTAIANYGIYSYYNQNVRMERNYIYGFSYWGIYSYYTNSSGTVRATISNNIINLNGPYIFTTQLGINSVSSSNIDIIHNTVYTVGAGLGSFACLVTPGTLGGVVIKNNIFHSTGSSSGALSVSTPTGITTCDHNILFSNFTTLVSWAAVSYIDVVTLRATSSPHNSNTYNKFSNFVSVVNQAENLHLTATSAADYGDPNFTTPLDVDGESRCLFAPTIGADESKFGAGIPTANFTLSDTIFVNSPVTLLNNNGIGSPLGHKWYVDGVLKGTGVDLPYLFLATGTYNIKLITTGCFGTDSITKTITVFDATQKPIANFISDVNTVETFQNVSFKDLTIKGPTYWNWTFIPSTGVNYTLGTSNYSQNPIVNFTNPGLYQVCLWDSNAMGRSATVCKTAYILVRSTSTMCIFPFDTKVSGGTIYDDGGPNGNYGPNHLAANPCNFLIDPCASSVTLSFTGFSLGLNAFLKVYDGKDKYGTPLHTAAGSPNGFTGSTFPPNLTANSGKMYIEFITATTLAPGFSATWSSVAGSYTAPTGSVDFPDTLYDCGALTDFTFVPNNPLFEKDGAYYRWYFDYGNSTIADAEGKGYYATPWGYSSLGSYIVRCEIEGCGGLLILQDTVYVAHPTGAPVINFSADITTATTGDVVTLTDNSRNGPIARKWKITGPSIPSIVSGNLTSKSVSVRFTATGLYTVSLRDSNCISSDSLTKINYINIINYCTPAVSTLNPDFALERTTFGRTDTIISTTVPGFLYINSTPALGTVAYRDNTDKFAAYNVGSVSITKPVEAIIDLGGTFSFAITRVSNYNQANFKMWIDYNQDGTFQSSELVASSGAIPNKTYSGSITVPLNAKLGNTRMRIATAFNNLSNTPCGANQYGEFNDFRVRVIADLVKPVIQFNGADTLLVEVGRNFVDPGFTVTDNTTSPCPYTYSGIANGTQITKHPSSNSYTIVATDATGNTSTRTRIVNSSTDITKPEITLVGSSPVYVEVKSTYNDSGATASDFYFGNFTPFITALSNVNVNIVGTYTVVYNVSDSSGNPANAITRTVIVRDTQKPVITLSTADTIYLNVFDVYVAPIVTITDNYNVGLTYTISGDFVNPNIIGTYNVFFHATDSSGNIALSKKFTVIVRDTKAPSILLNFGDTFVIDVNTMTTVPEPGYTLSDNYYSSGSLTLNVSYANVKLNLIGNYPVKYYVSDPSGNMDSSHIRVYKIVDRVAPVITVTGTPYLLWPRWKPYVDPGNIVTDNYYSTLTCVPDISKVNIYLPGVYEVTFDITDPSGNKAKQEKRTVQVTADANGIVNKGNSGVLKVYPNPSNGIFNLELDLSDSKVAEITVFDANGKVVYYINEINKMQKLMQIDLSNEASGMYFIKVVTDKNSASKAVSIQK